MWLPYGASEIPARLPAERLLEILRPDVPSPTEDYLAMARRALESNDALVAAAKESRRICVALGSCGKSDLTLSLTQTVLEFLAHVSPNPIVILQTPDSASVGQNAFSSTEIMQHNPSSSSMAALPAKTTFPIQLNSSLLNADLKIAVGELKPSQLLKFEGLTDTLLPGLASVGTIKKHLTDRVGLKLDDLYKERVEIGNSVPNLFILGYTIPDGLNPADFACGTFAQCLPILEKSVQQKFTKIFTKKADIVVMGAGGNPTDSSLSKAIETLPAGLSALKKNGSLILAAECENGHGDGEFYEWSAEGKEARYLEARVHRRLNYNGFKASLLRRAVDSHRIYLVSTMPDHYVESVFKMRASRSISAALQTVQRVQGADSSISVMPNGSRIITEFIEPSKPDQTPAHLPSI